MRAINLVPADRREGGLGGGRSGGLVYGVLGVLLVMLVAVAVLVSAGKKQKEAEQELAGLQQVTQQYTSAASQYSAIEKAAGDAKARISAVEGLAKVRFDWAGAMRDLSRVVPRSSQIESMSASVRPGTGNQGTSSSLRSNLEQPAITMQGCSVSQDTVADLIGRLQAMRRVTQVSLESSVLSKDATESCTVSSKGSYSFIIVVFYAPGSTVAAAEATPGSTTPTETTVAATTPTAGN